MSNKLRTFFSKENFQTSLKTPHSIGVLTFFFFNYFLIIFNLEPFYSIFNSNKSYNIYWIGGLNSFLSINLNPQLIWSVIQIWDSIWLLATPMCLILSFEQISQLLNDKLNLTGKYSFDYNAITIAIFISLIQSFLFYLSFFFIHGIEFEVRDYNYLLFLEILLGSFSLFYFKYLSNKDEMIKYLYEKKRILINEPDPRPIVPKKIYTSETIKDQINLIQKTD